MSSRLLTGIVLVAALALTAVAVTRTSSCAPGSTSSQAEDAGTAGEPQVELELPPPPSTDDADAEQPDAPTEPIARREVTIYYPASNGNGLVGEPHEIFMTASPGDRVKQIVADLISGPAGKSAMRALPAGTQLRQVFVLEDGTGYIDFSADLKQGLGGGSTEELLTVYAIINSVSLNIEEIRRLGILINGRPIETLNGHMDLRRPLPPNRSLILRVNSRIAHAIGTEAPIVR